MLPNCIYQGPRLLESDIVQFELFVLVVEHNLTVEDRAQVSIHLYHWLSVFAHDFMS
jgi:hypothetical protein